MKIKTIGLLICILLIVFSGLSEAGMMNDNKLQHSDKIYIMNGWYEQAKLLASDGANQDAFGCSVSLEGDTAFIGAQWNNDNGDSSGSVYVFKYDGSAWNEEVKLLASDAAKFSQFGCSVSLDGDTALIGAQGGDGNENNSGSAYVFKRNGTSWIEEAKLTASDGADNDLFGDSVSLDEDTALIGAMWDDDKGGASGSAYVFKYDGTTWNEEAKLLASDGATDDNFGYAISLDGDYALIGAFRDNDNGHQSGSAYVFKRNGTSWTQEAKLIASDGAENDMFGISVSLDVDYALIGAMRDDDHGSQSGSVYVFKRNGTSWIEEAKLIASEGGINHYFGQSVFLDGDTALIGAYGYDGFIGSAYLFKRNGTSWTQQVKFLAADREACFWFGYSVSLDKDTALIGSMSDYDTNGSQVGAAYIFQKGQGPDLYCDGKLSWSDVSPGDTIDGNFTVENIGESGSHLEWKIYEYPDWANWSFNPESGVGLTPEIGALTINVTVNAPNEGEKEFTGNITVLNKHNNSDYCIIPVYLKTPKNKPLIFNFTLISWLFERFPSLFPILRSLFNLN